MPIDIMSISVVTMMKRIAALRRGFGAAESLFCGVKSDGSRPFSRGFLAGQYKTDQFRPPATFDYSRILRIGLTAALPT
jgi:hypothetical protein